MRFVENCHPTDRKQNHRATRRTREFLGEGVPNLVRGVAVCGTFGLVYLGVTTLLGEGEARMLVRAVRRRMGGAR